MTDKDWAVRVQAATLLAEIDSSADVAAPIRPAPANPPAIVWRTEGQSEIRHLKLSYVGVMWGGATLSDIAREKGLQELYYVDLETQSLMTIWRQYTVHLYGR